LILFAAGLVGSAVHELNELSWVPAVVEHVYDLNQIVPETSTAGEFLRALFGYNANPSLTEMVAYITYFVVVFGMLQFFNRKSDADARAAA
jgi:high-affinity iron transporter